MCFTRNIWLWRVSRLKNSREISAIPGHMIIVHGLYSRSSPGHSRPPKFGGGWLQARVRVRVPFSHVTEHFPHEDHKLQAPLTEKRHLRVSTVLQRPFCTFNCYQIKDAVLPMHWTPAMTEHWLAARREHWWRKDWFPAQSRETTSKVSALP